MADITVKPEDICKDVEGLQIKENLMRRQRMNSFFKAVATVATFTAGIITAISMGLIGSAIKDVMTHTAVAGTTAAATSIPALLAAVPGVGWGLLAVAAVATVVAVGCTMAGDRYYHSANFDMTEVNAQHTAKYLSKELQQDSLCLTDEKAPARADGKNWTQVVEAQAAAGRQLQ